MGEIVLRGVGEIRLIAAGYGQSRFVEPKFRALYLYLLLGSLGRCFDGKGLSPNQFTRMMHLETERMKICIFVCGMVPGGDIEALTNSTDTSP